MYDSILAEMPSCFIDVSWTPGSFSTVYREEYSDRAGEYTEFLTRLSRIDSEELSRSLLEYASDFFASGSDGTCAGHINTQDSGISGEARGETGNEPGVEKTPVYEVSCPDTGPGSDRRLNELTLCALERISLSGDPFPSSAAFVCSCGADAGLTGTGEFPATAVPDELYSFLISSSGCSRYYLKPLLGTDSGDTPCLSGLLGSVIFLKDGSDREFLEWLPGCTYPEFTQCGIITGAGPGYVEFATADCDGIPSVESLDLQSCPDSAVVLRLTCRDFFEIVSEYLKRCLGYNDAVIAGICANISTESGFDPCISGDGGSSYGLCQWHCCRYRALQDYCRQTESSPSDFRTQIHFLAYEICTDYPDLDALFSETENSPEGARRAAEAFCLEYECPADAYSKCISRSNLAAECFFPLISASG